MWVRQGTKGGVKFKAAEDVSEYLITEKLISTVPWDDVGNYLRFSSTFIAKNEEDERRVIAEMKKRLGELELVF